MYNEMDAAFNAGTIIIAIISLIIALERGGTWSKKNPDKLGFKWGYFFIISTTLFYGVIFSTIPIALFIDGDILASLMFAVLLLPLLYLSKKAMQRRKWALVTLTIISFNLLWMVINIFYFRNRWAEFSEERSGPAPHKTDQIVDREPAVLSEEFHKFSEDAGLRFRSLSKPWRLAIFASVSWALLVFIFVMLFNPYGGYMRDSDYGHMLALMFLPNGAALGLYWAYARFVR